MKALIIGYGSIGRRHADILSQFNQVSQIDLVTKQSISGYCVYSSIEAVDNLAEYDYFIISTETAKHYDCLKALCTRVSEKNILVEKPLYDKHYQSFDLNNNRVFVAYNLRFHPVMQALKKTLSTQKILCANVRCGQYLPQWRPGTDYRQSYSASCAKGGGVLRDLSHELDYSAWLFGDFSDDLSIINKKISMLDITSDDVFTCIGTTHLGVVLNISMDYISKKPIRQLLVHCDQITVQADFILNTLEITDINGAAQNQSFEFDRNDTYRHMHEAILSGHTCDACSYTEGLKTLDIFDDSNFSIAGKGH